MKNIILIASLLFCCFTFCSAQQSFSANKLALTGTTFNNAKQASVVDLTAPTTAVITRRGLVTPQQQHNGGIQKTLGQKQLSTPTLNLDKKNNDGRLGNGKITINNRGAKKVGGN